MSISLPNSADVAACRETLRGGSKSFYLASFLLPRRVREPASILYAFCRIADDEVDLHGGDLDAVARLRRRLDRIYDGRPDADAIDRALVSVVHHHGIPKQFLEALLEGLEWDATGRAYDDIASLRAYAVRVAGSVGAMMCLLMGERRPDVVSLACDLGVAMQLTNIARDVGEDARSGRIYLPRRWLYEAGVDPQAWLEKPTFNDAVASVVERLLGVAEALYERADLGIRRLPLGCRPGIYAARFLYAEIGREVERHGLDSVSRRAVVPSGRKVALLAKSFGECRIAAADVSTETLREAMGLIDSLAHAPNGAWADGAAPRVSSLARIDDRVGWVVDLFQRLEREEQLMRSRGRA